MESDAGLGFGLSGILFGYISSHLLVYKDAGWLADGIANSRYVSGLVRIY